MANLIPSVAFNSRNPYCTRPCDTEQTVHFVNRAAKFFYTVNYVAREGVATVFVVQFKTLKDMKAKTPALEQQWVIRSCVAGNAYGKFCDCVKALQIRISEFANEAKTLGLKDTVKF